MVGFAAKVIIFREAIGVDLVSLAAIGVVNVLISVAYYLNVVRAMYVERGETDAPIYAPSALGTVVLVSSVGLVALTFASMPFWGLALEAARAFFGS